jgi:hypothetical protein
MKEYKNIMKKFMMILMAVALIALPTMAQQQEWQSTSAMQTSGSNYTPQVNAIGAEGAYQMATTTTTDTYSPGRAHRAKKEGDDDPWGHNQDAGEQDGASPIGDAMLPLMLCALAFGGAIAFRRRREA